jgi:hypothetical protein
MWVRALQSVRRNWAIAVVMIGNLQELRPQAEPAGGKPAGSESDGSGHRRAAAKEAIDVPDARSAVDQIVSSPGGASGRIWSGCGSAGGHSGRAEAGQDFELKPGDADATGFLPLMSPVPAAELDAVPANPVCNSPKYGGPDYLQPVSSQDMSDADGRGGAEQSLRRPPSRSHGA